MITLSRWLIREHLNVTLVFAGLFIVFVAASWGLFAEARVNGLHTKPVGFDAFLYDHHDRIERVAAGTIMVGMTVSLTGMFRMIRAEP